MSEGSYRYTGPVDCTVAPDKSQCKGKSVIITAGHVLAEYAANTTAIGAQGIGETYVRGYIDAGAFVTFCDINEEKGKALEAELSSERTCFVKADTRSWEDQVEMFEAASARSPNQSVDIVIANAGVGRGSGDPMMSLEDPSMRPTKPSIHIIDINLIGAMYTFKLAVHYFRRSSLGPDRDRCFIFGGSIAGSMDNLGSWEYSTAKFGLRGLMRTVRRHSHRQHIRVAYIAPSYIRTVIQSEEVYESMRAKGIEFASLDSCLAAVMRISCDKTINGRAFVIVPYSEAKEGFFDIDEDDRVDESKHLTKFQELAVKLRGDDWQ